MWSALFLLACAAPPSAPRVDDAYVWQRAWTPSVAEAVDAGAAVFDAYRVQALAVDGDGTWALSDEPLAALAEREAVPVARIEVGTSIGGPLGRVLAATVTRWRAAGVRVAAVEIDHDCPTSRLQDYARGLREVREALPADVALWVTALPTWLEAPAALEAVRGAVDGTVLQVHAVDAPGDGLFDAERAHAWIAAYASARRPFRIALPAYGVRVDPVGRVVAEADRLAAEAGGREVWAEPAAVVSLLAALDAAPPPGWVGTAWFRLPVRGDRRAWSLETLAAVIQRETPAAAIRAEVVDQGEVWDLMLVNDGIADGPSPAQLAIHGDCTSADGVGGYAVAPADGGFRMDRHTPGRVPAEGTLAVGWVRCADLPRLEVER